MSFTCRGPFWLHDFVLLISTKYDFGMGIYDLWSLTLSVELPHCRITPIAALPPKAAYLDSTIAQTWDFSVFNRNSVFLNFAEPFFCLFFIYNKGFFPKNMIFRLFFLRSIMPEYNTKICHALFHMYCSCICRRS